MKNTKKLIAFLFTILLSPISFAQVLMIPVGDFKFQGQLQTLTVKKTEMVPMGNVAGEARLQALRSQGWVCTYQAGNQAKCSIFSKEQDIPEKLVKELNAKYQNYQIQFSDQYGASLTNETDFILEYDVQQGVQINAEAVSNYQMRIMLNTDLTKLQIETPLKRHHFNVIDRNRLAIIEMPTVIDKLKSTLYMIQVELSK